MFPHDIPEDEYGRRRLADIRAEISGRLSNVTAIMSAESREELLTQMALLQWNAERGAVVRTVRQSLVEEDAKPMVTEADRPDLGPIVEIE